MAITDWPVDERPRERLIKHGAEALSDAELLAVFLRVGVAGKSAVDLARDLIAHFGSLGRLFAASKDELSAVNGMGPAKYTVLQASFEMSRRALYEELQNGAALSSPKAVKEYLQMRIGSKPYEAFVVLFLDVKNRLIACDELFRGTLTQTSVYPREIVKASLAHNAAAIILAHNHPSGAPEPSPADKALTHMLKQTMSLIDVRVLDHLVVTANNVYSFAEHGLM